MAILHRATLRPGKLDLLAAWLPSRPWAAGLGDVRQVGAYRLDDPAGEVGLAGFVLEAGDGTVLHVPVTYRGAPLEGAEEHLVGTMEHSVLGQRWVYDACGDPVWVTAVATAALTGGRSAEEVFRTEHGEEVRERNMDVRGSGATGTEVPIVYEVTCEDGPEVTLVRTDGLEVTLAHRLGADAPGETLTGTWAGGGPVVLAGVRVV
jgi:hypothetical protein